MKTDVRTEAQRTEDARKRRHAAARRDLDTVAANDVWKVAQETARRLMSRSRGFTAEDRHDVASDALTDAIKADLERSRNAAMNGSGRRPCHCGYRGGQWIDSTRCAHCGGILAGRTPDARLDADLVTQVKRDVDAARKRMERERKHRDAAPPVDLDDAAPVVSIATWTKVLSPGAAHRRAIEFAQLASPTRRPFSYHVYLLAYYELRAAQGFTGEQVAEEVAMSADALRKGVQRGRNAVTLWNAADDLREFLLDTAPGGRKPHASPASTPWRQSGPMSATLVLDSYRQRAHAAMNAAAAADWTSALRRWIVAV